MKGPITERLYNTDIEAYRLLLRQLGEAQAEIERLEALCKTYEREIAALHLELDDE